MVGLKFLAWIRLLRVACAAPAADLVSESATVQLVELSEGEVELQRAFNANSDLRQLVVILSPT